MRGAATITLVGLASVIASCASSPSKNASVAGGVATPVPASEVPSATRTDDIVDAATPTVSEPRDEPVVAVESPSVDARTRADPKPASASDARSKPADAGAIPTSASQPTALERAREAALRGEPEVVRRLLELYRRSPTRDGPGTDIKLIEDACRIKIDRACRVALGIEGR